MSRFPFDDLPQDGRTLEEIVQRATQKPLPRRFYRKAVAVASESGFIIELDGRTARTPARNVLLVPNAAIAEIVVAEWAVQNDHIDPNSMPCTRIVNSAIDGVATRRQDVVEDLVRYAGSDLILYRAEGPERLVAEQESAWDPILVWCRETLGASFVPASGIMHRPQPAAAIAAVREEVENVVSPFGLAALHTMTTLAGSVLVSIAHGRGLLGADAAWEAAHVDELYQERRWGRDDEAFQRRAARQRVFQAASRIFLSI